MKRLLGLFFSVVLLLATPISSFAFYTNMDASIVVGQSNFGALAVNAGGGITSGGLSDVSGVWMDGTRLYVVEASNHRVLIWNSIPTHNGVTADVVVGQQNFTSGSSNQGNASPTASTMRSPQTVTTAGNKLIIADDGNRRVLIYNQIPTSNNVAADVVIGQSIMTTRTSGTSQTAIKGAYGVSYDPDSGKLLVSDYSNSRVLIYNQIPTANGALADVVVGQTTWSGGSANQGGSRSASTLNQPISARIINGKLVVADWTNSRVLIWNTIPTTNGASADTVLGQANFTALVTTTDANHMSEPADIAWSKDRLFVADGGNHRILVYNTFPSGTTNPPADTVIGQQNFTSAVWFSSAPTLPNRIAFDYTGMAIAGNLLAIADNYYNRVLFFRDEGIFPRLSLGTPHGFDDSGKLRSEGSVAIDSGIYNIDRVEASVNGGDYTPVTSLSSSIHTNSTQIVGKTDTLTASFFHDFEPWARDNGSVDEWKTKQKEMLQIKGFTIKLRGVNNNQDISDPILYFRPFFLVSPQPAVEINGAQFNDGIPVSFVVSSQRTELKNYLDHYEIWIKSTTSDTWNKYLTDIPVDYEIAKDKADNKKQGAPLIIKGVVADPTTGNGLYENAFMGVTYTDNGSRIEVMRINSQEGTLQTLDPGSYELKITAVDKSHAPHDSDNTLLIQTQKISTKKAPTAIAGASTSKEPLNTASEPDAMALSSPLPIQTSLPSSSVSKVLQPWRFCFLRWCWQW